MTFKEGSGNESSGMSSGSGRGDKDKVSSKDKIMNLFKTGKNKKNNK